VARLGVELAKRGERQVDCLRDLEASTLLGERESPVDQR
jgi:hypothetical protein